MQQVYDCIGETYRGTRRADPRIAKMIWAALGDAASVVNVGAGAGSYEPSDRDVVAVEPSWTMIRQRPRNAAPAIQARAEALPLRDSCFDAALAVNTLHHWRDVRAGLRELRRVARRRIVILLRDPAEGVDLWLTRKYFPTLVSNAHLAKVRATVTEELAPLATIPVPLPANCEDGVFSAYWARPEAYLDPEVRRNISNFALAKPSEVSDGVALLRSDLESGEWDQRHGHLRQLPALDVGHRLLVAEA